MPPRRPAGRTVLVTLDDVLVRTWQVRTGLPGAPARGQAGHLDEQNAVLPFAASRTRKR